MRLTAVRQLSPLAVLVVVAAALSVVYSSSCLGRRSAAQDSQTLARVDDGLELRANPFP